MTRRHLALVFVGVVAVSSSAVLVRLADAPGLAAAFYRCLFASVVLVPLTLARHRGALARLSAKDRYLLVACGFVLAAHFASWLPSINLTSVAASTLLVQTSPVWVIVLGRLVGERATRGGITGVVLALVGTATIVGGGVSGGSNVVLGDLLAIAGAFFGAIYILIGRRLRPSLALVPYTAAVYAVAAACLGVVMAASGTPFGGYPASTWVAFVAMTVGPQFLGHTVFNYLLGYLRASIVSVALLAEPVGASILALVVFGEAPSVPTVIGGAIILAGVYLAIRSESRAAEELVEAPLE